MAHASILGPNRGLWHTVVLSIRGYRQLRLHFIPISVGLHTTQNQKTISIFEFTRSRPKSTHSWSSKRKRFDPRQLAVYPILVSEKRCPRPNSLLYSYFCIVHTTTKSKIFVDDTGPQMNCGRLPDHLFFSPSPISR